MPSQRRPEAVLSSKSGTGLSQSAIHSRYLACGKINLACGKGGKPVPRGSVTGPGVRRKIFLELAFFTLEILRVGRGFLLLGNIWPGFGIFGVHFKPLLEPRLGIRLDRVGGTFGLAHAAIDALVRVDDQHVLALVKAID